MSNGAAQWSLADLISEAPWFVPDFAAHVREGMPVRAVARRMGLNPGTVEKWLYKGRQIDAVEPFKGFASAIEESQGELVAELAGKLRKSPDWRAQHALLRAICPEFEPPKGNGQSLAVLVQQTGYSADAIRVAIDDGTIPRHALGEDASGRRYIADVGLAASALLSPQPPGGHPVPPGGTPIDAQGVDVTKRPASLHEARARRTHALAEKAEIEAAKARGDLIDRAAVQALIDDALGMLSQRLQAIPQRVAVDVARLTDPHAIALAIDAEIRKSLATCVEELNGIGGRDDDAAAG